jgi:hypothetical protein
MKTKRGHLLKCSATLAAGAMLALLGSSTAAYAQDVTENLRSPDAEIAAEPLAEASVSPEGSWLYTVNISGFTFQGIETYAFGGGYTEADQLSFMPTSVASAGHGAWKKTGNRTFLLTYLNLTFNSFSAGTATGTLKVRQTTTIDKTGNSYTGSGDYAYYDTNGDPIPGSNGSGTFTITATRIQVQAPAKN